MTMVEEGQYAVDFHANLSPLQAFSICVAILHGNSSFSGTGKAKNQQISRCNSLKMLLEEEVELFINSVTKEENKNVSKIQKGISRPSVLTPPLSPIARVYRVVYTCPACCSDPSEIFVSAFESLI